MEFNGDVYRLYWATEQWLPSQLVLEGSSGQLLLVFCHKDRFFSTGAHHICIPKAHGMYPLPELGMLLIVGSDGVQLGIGELA
jgi:hypothetical protein